MILDQMPGVIPAAIFLYSGSSSRGNAADQEHGRPTEMSKPSNARMATMPPNCMPEVTPPPMMVRVRSGEYSLDMAIMLGHRPADPQAHEEPANPERKRVCW